MDNKRKITDKQLNDLIKNSPLDMLQASLGLKPSSLPKKWIHVPIGNIDTYVGGKKYVVSIMERIATDPVEIAENSSKTEEIVVKYLKSEGFIKDSYLFIALQRMNSDNSISGSL